MKTKLILNPVAGRGKARELFPLVQKRLKEEGIEYDLAPSRARGDAERLAQAAKAEGYRRLVVCGGDGTVSEVINALIKTDVVLGIIPLGIGNDFARNLGIKEDVDFASRLLNEGKVKDIDVVKTGRRGYYGSVGGVGFDAEIVSFVNRWKRFVPRTLIHPFYIGTIMMQIGLCRPHKVRMKYDGTTFSGEILMVSFGNTASYARVIHVSPSAVADDGLLDICIVRRLSKLKIALLFVRILTRMLSFRLPEVRIYQEIPGVEVHQARRVCIESDTPLPFHGDAEIISATPVCLEVVPGALKVIVPDRAPVVNVLAVCRE